MLFKYTATNDDRLSVRTCSLQNLKYRFWFFS